MFSIPIAFPCDFQTSVLGLIARIKFLPDETIFQYEYERIASLVKPCFKIPQLPPDFTEIETCVFMNTREEKWFENLLAKKKAIFIWLIAAFEVKQGRIFEEFVNITNKGV